jgi:hypothetical protein
LAFSDPPPFCLLAEPSPRGILTAMPAREVARKWRR